MAFQDKHVIDCTIGVPRLYEKYDDGYVSGYDGQGDWNVYSRYMNLDGGMTQVKTLFSGSQSCDYCVLCTKNHWLDHFV